MASEIISDSSAVAGGVLALDNALRHFPDRGLVVYHRCSSFQQAGRGKAKLIENSREVMNKVRQIAAAAPGLARVMRVPFYEVAKGKMSHRRPVLEESADYAKARGSILVAADLSRFIRAEAYDRRTNIDAFPTDEELAQLRERTGGIQLATVVPPYVSESDRHSEAIRRRGKHGRPANAVTLIQFYRALKLLGRKAGYATKEPGGRWEQSLSKVASQLGISRSALARKLNEEVPADLLGGQEGRTWKELAWPYEVMRGLLINHDPPIISKL